MNAPIETPAQIPFTTPPQRIADLPIDERPANRLDKHGAATLSDAELLAVLLELDTMEEARATLALAADHCGDVLLAVRKNHGGKAVLRYAAALETHRRLTMRAVESDDRPAGDTEAIGRRLIATYANAMQERLGAIALDSRRRILSQREIYIGTVNHASVSTRDVIRFALDQNAASVVLFHNHPSGDPSPSAEDLMFTRKISESLRLCDIELADHIVTGSMRYYSMRERGQL